MTDRVQVTVTMALDGAHPERFMEDVRIALESSPHMVAHYGGVLLGLVAAVPGDPDSVYRHATRVPTGGTIRS